MGPETPSVENHWLTGMEPFIIRGSQQKRNVGFDPTGTQHSLQLLQLPLQLQREGLSVPRLEAVGGLREAGRQLGKVLRQLGLLRAHVGHAEGPHHAPGLQVVQGHVVNVGKGAVGGVSQDDLGVLAEVEARPGAGGRDRPGPGRLVVHGHEADGEVVEVKGADDPGVVRDRQHRFGSHLEYQWVFEYSKLLCIVFFLVLHVGVCIHIYSQIVHYTALR